MNISIVVVNYNDYKTTINYLKKISIYKIIDNIIVVDNFSTDDSYNILKNLENDKIKVIKTELNKGYGGGNNFGIKYAIENFNPKYIIISNPDVYFEENIITEMLKFYSENNNVGIISPIMVMNGEEKYSAWKLATYKDDIINNLCILKKIIKINNNIYSFNQKYKEVEVVSGAFFMINTDLMKKVQMFDEDIFLYCEERILYKKLSELGYKNYILSHIKYNHEHSVSINNSIKGRAKKYKLYTNSLLKFYTKYSEIGKFKMLLLKFSVLIGYYERLIFDRLKFILKE